MSRRKSFTAVIASLLLGIAVAPEVRSEVAVETDAFGRYVRTSIYTQSSLRSVKIWRQVRRNMGGIHALNPAGDRAGDLYPFVAENPRDGRRPIAVWSRFNGIDYDLVWSRWQGTSWTPIEWVQAPGTVAAGDDVQPFLAFDSTGRPYLTWWRDENGVGTVYVSFFLVTRWSPPILVSDPGVDSRSPRISAMSATQMRVDFPIPGGLESRLVTYSGPTTITDDLNPVGQVSISSYLTERSTWP